MSTNIARKFHLGSMVNTIPICFYLLPMGLLQNYNTKARTWNNMKNTKSNKRGSKQRASGVLREWKIWRISRLMTPTMTKSRSRVKMKSPCRNSTISMSNKAQTKKYFAPLIRSNWNRNSRLHTVLKTWCCRLLMNQGRFKCHSWIETDLLKKSS